MEEKQSRGHSFPLESLGTQGTHPWHSHLCSPGMGLGELGWRGAKAEDTPASLWRVWGHGGHIPGTPTSARWPLLAERLLPCTLWGEKEEGRESHWSPLLSPRTPPVSPPLSSPPVTSPRAPLTSHPPVDGVGAVVVEKLCAGRLREGWRHRGGSHTPSATSRVPRVPHRGPHPAPRGRDKSRGRSRTPDPPPYPRR